MVCTISMPRLSFTVMVGIYGLWLNAPYSICGAERPDAQKLSRKFAYSYSLRNERKQLRDGLKCALLYQSYHQFIDVITSNQAMGQLLGRCYLTKVQLIKSKK